MKGKSMKPRCCEKDCRRLAVVEMSTPDMRITSENGVKVDKWKGFHYCALHANMFLYGSPELAYKSFEEGRGYPEGRYRVFFL